MKKNDKRTALVVAGEWMGVCSESMTDKVLLDLLTGFMEVHNKTTATQEAQIKLVCDLVDKFKLTDKLDDFLRAAAEGGLSDPAAE
jgi:hypothetical protein